LESTRAYYRLRRRDISFLRFVLEACDGIGFVRTLNARSGIVAIHMPAGCEPEVQAVVCGLRQSICMEAVGRRAARAGASGPEGSPDDPVDDALDPVFDFYPASLRGGLR
jgi:hypothetical protein